MITPQMFPARCVRRCETADAENLDQFSKSILRRGDLQPRPDVLSAPREVSCNLLCVIQDTSAPWNACLHEVIQTACTLQGAVRVPQGAEARWEADVCG